MRVLELIIVMFVASLASSASAQVANRIVRNTQHVLDTREEFEHWCREELKGVASTANVKGMATTSCRWKDQYKNEFEAVRMRAAGRSDRGSADCVAIHYPEKLYSQVDHALRLKFGAKKRTIKSREGIVSKGWFVLLDEREGAVSNLKKGGNGVVYGCLL